MHFEDFDYSQLIGKSYEEMNCWDLVKEFYSLGFGIELKNYCNSIPSDRGDKRALIYCNVGDFEQVFIPRFGDLILFKIKGLESHIGAYVGRETFIHSSRTKGSVIERISRWEPLIAGYYRLKEIND